VGAVAVTPELAPALVQYGALGVLALCAVIAVRVLFQQITANALKDRERADRLEEQLRAVNASLQDKALPAIVAATATISAAMDVLRRGEDRR
jgi:hypothetical protein